MTLNHLLAWMVGLSSLTGLFSSLRHRTYGWMAVFALTLVTLGLSGWWIPTQMGLVSGTVWGVFVVLPMLGIRVVNRLIFQERYQLASGLSWGLRWLHPTDGWWEHAHLLQVLALAQQGEVDAAHSILNRQYSSNAAIQFRVKGLLLGMTAQWDDLVSWIRQEVPPPLLTEEPVLMRLYLRALGETGAWEDLVTAFQRYHPLLAQKADFTSIYLSQMTLLAFGGRIRSVDLLFQGPLRPIRPHWRQFWLATARLVSRQSDQALRNQAQSEFQHLSNHPDPVLKQALEWRTRHPLVESPSDRIPLPFVEQLEQELTQQARYTWAFVSPNQNPWVTWLFVGLNGLMFVLEIRSGGSQNPETLYRLGALIPTLVWEGEAWRLVASLFLHYGWLHLVMNMAALLVLGPFVESSLGHWRFLLSYLLSGVGSMLVVVILAGVLLEPDLLLVGASGSIMGLVGITVTIFLKGWRHQHSRIAARGLQALVALIVVQTIFDLTTPQVSFSAHFSGLILGFCWGWLLVPDPEELSDPYDSGDH